MMENVLTFKQSNLTLSCMTNMFLNLEYVNLANLYTLDTLCISLFRGIFDVSI